MSERPYLRDASKAIRAIAQGEGLGVPLNEKEEQMVLAIMDGHTTTKTLASALKGTLNSVNNYKYRVYAKSGALNMAHLVLMITGALPCPEVLLPVQRKWRRKQYKLDQQSDRL